MPEPELPKSTAGPKPEETGAGTPTPSQGVAGQTKGDVTAQPQATATDPSSVTYSAPPAYFVEALEDAELLLKYGAETGKDVDATTRNSVLEARAVVGKTWNENIIANLLIALTILAAKLKPVTAESLRYFESRKGSKKKWLHRLKERARGAPQPESDEAKDQAAKGRESALHLQHTVRRYWGVAIVLAVIIVPFSVASFITSGLSGLIHKDINTANDLAVQLTTQFGLSTNQVEGAAQTQADPCQPQSPAAPAAAGSSSQGFSLPAGLSPTNAVTELSSFASLIRSIYARSVQLNWFVAHWAYDPFTKQLNDPKVGYRGVFQLPVPLPADLRAVVGCRVLVLQDTRQFGQNVMDDVSVSYGAMATCILPVLYALLGTCAYLLRSYAQGMSTRTFVPSHSDSAHFLIAGIAGGVVGLFNNFNFTAAQGVSISPLAIAFLVGYSVDVFFSFLETLIQAFTKDKSATSAPSSSPVPKGADSQAG